MVTVVDPLVVGLGWVSTATYVKLSSPTKLASVGVYVNDPVELAPTAIVTSPCEAAVNEFTLS
jgi:hypothetical protein